MEHNVPSSEELRIADTQLLKYSNPLLYVQNIKIYTIESAYCKW